MDKLDTTSVGLSISLPAWMINDVILPIVQANAGGMTTSSLVRGWLLARPEFQERVAQAMGGEPSHDTEGACHER